MAKDCNFKVTLKGAMIDENGKSEMINRDFTGEGVTLFVNKDTDNEHTILEAVVMGASTIETCVKMISTLKQVWAKSALPRR